MNPTPLVLNTMVRRNFEIKDTDERSLKLIVAGSRTITFDAHTIGSLIRHFQLKPTEIVSGGASGIDQCAAQYARLHPYLKFMEFRADWDRHGKSAGPMRNAEMADYADALLLIWDGSSRGSASMRAEMLKRDKPIYEVVLKLTDNTIMPIGRNAFMGR